MKKLALLLVLLVLGIGLATDSALAVCDQVNNVVEFVATVPGGPSIIFINTPAGGNRRHMTTNDPDIVGVANAAMIARDEALNRGGGLQALPTVNIRGDAAACPAAVPGTWPFAGVVQVIQSTR